MSKFSCLNWKIAFSQYFYRINYVYTFIYNIHFRYSSFSLLLVVIYIIISCQRFIRILFSACYKENTITSFMQITGSQHNVACKPVYGCLTSYRKRWLDIVFVLRCEIDISCTSDVIVSKAPQCSSDYRARALRRMIASSCKRNVLLCQVERVCCVRKWVRIIVRKTNTEQKILCLRLSFLFLLKKSSNDIFYNRFC